MFRMLLSVVLCGLAIVGPATASDVALGGYGDDAGYHVLLGQRRGETVVWRELAVLAPSGIADRSWTGHKCLSTDGRHAAVAVLPLTASNHAAAIAAHGFGYLIDVRRATVRPVSSAVAVGYDTPGCGRGRVAAFRAFPDEHRTTVLLAGPNAQRTVLIDGQLTSPVPWRGGIAGGLGDRLVTVTPGGRITPVARTGGTPYDVRAGRGGLSWLSSRFGAPAAEVWRDGRLDRVVRRAGTVMVGAGQTVAGAADSVASTGGSFLTSAGARLPIAVDVISGRQLHAVRSGGAAPVIRRIAESRHVLATAADAADPSCAVLRLDPTRQALQPDEHQVDWAVQMAERGLLTDAHGRPPNFANMGLPSYSANGDFPRVPLHHPSRDSWDTVPRSVMEAILAQESNWNQASFHALPGIAGDPLIADYYGNGANTIDHINYPKADCGYGIAQVTDGMRRGDLPSDLQAKIAVDYQENIAAGLSILERAWNQLYDSGITANGGNPRYLENWYFAIWAYNTGIQPNAAHGNTTGCRPSPSCTGPDGTWGLGWANNPANPQYPPNRALYLKVTYADAAHPADWPYQERVMGWMASPLLGYTGKPRYAGPDYHGAAWIALPKPSQLCSASANRCTGAGPFTAGTCQLADFACWFHEPISWVDCPASCATSSYDVGSSSTEPVATDPHPPVCRLDLGSTSGPVVVVDDLPSPGLNLVGCRNESWVTQGSFSMDYGRDAAGAPVGAIDLHQLGAGFGGHILFTHTERGDRPDLLNTGIWRPDLPTAQNYEIFVHVPATGADVGDAQYVIATGGYGNPKAVQVDQRQGSDRWVPLGTFALGPGATVTLTNASAMPPESADVAYDAIAFAPRGGIVEATEPTTSVPTAVAPPAAAQSAPPSPEPVPRCDAGDDPGFWNVFKVTASCIGTLQVFKDPTLGPGASCVVKTGVELLPLLQIGKAKKAVGGFAKQAKELRRELKRVKVSLPKQVDLGLRSLSAIDDLHQHPVLQTIKMMVSTRLVLILVRQRLTAGVGRYGKAFKLLKRVQEAGQDVLDVIAPVGDAFQCVNTLKERGHR